MPITVRVSPNPPSKKAQGGKRIAGEPKPKAGPAALKGLEASLSKFHSQSDHDLAAFIEPHPDKKDNQTHRLNEEQREARLVLMHRMLLRKVPPEEARSILGISIAMYYILKDQLDARMRLDVSKVDVPYLIGDTLAFYDEVRSMSLTMASSSKVSASVKVAAMHVALRAEQEKNQFLTSCGVYSPVVVEHIVRSMVSTGNFNLVDGQSERLVEAEEVNAELAIRLKQFAAERTVLSAVGVTGG